MKFKNKKHVSEQCEALGLDLGSSIRSWFAVNPEYSMVEVAKKLGLTKMAFYHKLNSAHYGSTYDILKLSLVTKYDFINIISNVYRNKGLPVLVTYTESQIKELKEEIKFKNDLLERCLREADVLHGIIKSYK